MGREFYNEAVAALREAPFDPASWPRALDATARACGAASAQVLNFGQCRFTPVVAPGFSDDDVSAFLMLEGANPAVNHGLRAVLKTPVHAVLSDEEYLPEGQRERDPLYNEFFRRYDGEYIAGGVVARNQAAISNLNLFLPRRTGGLGAEARRTLRRLLPKFTQALRLTMRVEAMAIALAGGAWEAKGDAVVICDADGAVLYASREAERLLTGKGAACGIAERRLTGFDTATDQRLKAALRLASAPVAAESRRLVASTGNGGRMTLDVTPLPLSSVGVAPKALVLLRTSDPVATLDHALLKTTFLLTTAECEVASGVMRRLSSAEIARLRGVSVETVNTQVKSVLAKTGAADRGRLTLLLEGFADRRTVGS